MLGKGYFEIFLLALFFLGNLSFYEFSLCLYFCPVLVNYVDIQRVSIYFILSLHFIFSFSFFL